MGRLPSRRGGGVRRVFTCLPSPAAVAEVLTGESGVLAGLRPGGTWIDSSTNDRHELLRLAALAEATACAASRRPSRAASISPRPARSPCSSAATPTSSPSTCRRSRRSARRVFHIGPLGSASVIKVITNMLAFIHLVAAGEALMLARRAGLDLAQSFEVIKASSGTSFVHETESQVILNGSYDIGFTLDLACKDLGFAHELGDELGVPLELASARRADIPRAREAVRRLGVVADGGEAARGCARNRPSRARLSRAGSRRSARALSGRRGPYTGVRCRSSPSYGCRAATSSSSSTPSPGAVGRDHVAVLPPDRRLQDLRVKAAPVPDPLEQEEVRACTR